MPAFSERSAARLATCHPDIQAVFNEVIKHRDCTVIEGVRDVETQREYVRTGRSQTMNSRHLRQPVGFSHAVDVAPYPIDWRDPKGFALFAGYVLATADRMLAEGVIERGLVWGGDWDDDGNVREHSFFDGPHFQRA